MASLQKYKQLLLITKPPTMRWRKFAYTGVFGLPMKGAKEHVPNPSFAHNGYLRAKAELG